MYLTVCFIIQFKSQWRISSFSWVSFWLSGSMLRKDYKTQWLEDSGSLLGQIAVLYIATMFVGQRWTNSKVWNSTLKFAILIAVVIFQEAREGVLGLLFAINHPTPMSGLAATASNSDSAIFRNGKINTRLRNMEIGIGRVWRCVQPINWSMATK